ncbi:transposase [Deinococcus rubellus]|uniref:transposase n=1 Tax=Deinococcus rubellus TaxID=1889240 RepID=UPI0031E59594
MSLKIQPLESIPEETVRVAHLAFPKGTVAMKLRDAFQQLYQDESFQTLYSRRGPPAFSPWRLALVTVLQFMENLIDRQVADAVRGRIDWKYALALELTDPGFHFSVLSEFRGRLVGSSAQALLLELMLERFRGEKLVKARGKQRTDSTHVLAAVREIHFTELIAETLRTALNDLATVEPGWLREVAPPAWFERYSWRIEDKHLPHALPARTTYLVQVGQDGFALLDAVQTHDAGESVTVL